jgi:hypothetical protein
MWWFRKEKPKEVEVWDEQIHGPIGDIEAAEKIRDICRSVADSAGRIGNPAALVDGKQNKPDNNQNERDSERYQRAARAAMEIAMKISDDLMRDAAVREIVDLCVKANDMRTAPILFRAIQAASIREAVLNDHPGLRQQ